ncbi:DEAD/DEAH box helicase, partial [Myxococcota bacterium]|nr:DEAD/DEAH box helicase [Myxococcota bacterium]
MSGFESVVEEAAIAWLTELGWQHVPGPVLAPDGEAPERESYRAVILEGRLRRALARVNDHLPPEALDEVVRAVTRLDSPSLEERNHSFHKLVREGVAVKVMKDGRERGDLAWLFDHDDPGKNDWLVVNQLTVVEGNNKRRPDLVLYVNGLPLA